MNSKKEKKVQNDIRIDPSARDKIRKQEQNKPSKTKNK